MKIVYHGNVEITSMHSKYTAHNAGTELLFKRITDMLAGNTVPSKSLPTYIQLMDLTNVTQDNLGENPITTGILYNPILVSKSVDLKQTPSGPKWTTVISGIIVPENISKEGLYDDLRDNPDTVYALVLLDSLKKPLAVIQLHEESLLDLDQGYETLIQWNMSFDNGEDENESGQ